MSSTENKENDDAKPVGRRRKILRTVLGVTYITIGIAIAYLAGWQGIVMFGMDEIPMMAQILGYIATVVALGLAIVAMGASMFPPKPDARIDELLSELTAVRGELSEMRGELSEIKKSIDDGGIQSGSGDQPLPEEGIIMRLRRKLAGGCWV